MAKAIVLILLLLASTAQANAIYSFSGTCVTTCTGTAVIELTMKTPTIDLENFISIRYADNLHDIFWREAAPAAFWNCRFAAQFTCEVLTLPEFNFTDPVLTPTVEFKTHTNGTWSSFLEIMVFGPYYRASGNNGVWLLNGQPLATVPEPSTWTLMLLGLAILLKQPYSRYQLSPRLQAL